MNELSTDRRRDGDKLDSMVLHVLSLGAGVQSSTMALMAKHGDILPMPVCAIFADTGWEPKEVYDWLAWLTPQLPFPVHTVSAGNIRNDLRRSRGRTTMPFFLDTGAEKEGKARRKCTQEFKINPIENFIKRTLLQIEAGKRLPKTVAVIQWRGITTDEATRLRPSRERWMNVRYPLALEKNMSRGDCLAWMKRHGYPEPPRSACIGCPFHSNHEWRRMKVMRPDEFADAVAFEREIHADPSPGGLRSRPYLHRSLVPLDKVDLSTDEDKGQGSLFAMSCETGYCGT